MLFKFAWFYAFTTCALSGLCQISSPPGQVAVDIIEAFSAQMTALDNEIKNIPEYAGSIGILDVLDIDKAFEKASQAAKDAASAIRASEPGSLGLALEISGAVQKIEPVILTMLDHLVERKTVLSTNGAVNSIRQDLRAFAEEIFDFQNALLSKGLPLSLPFGFGVTVDPAITVAIQEYAPSEEE